MLENTNIVTVRDYGKHGRFVEINGRDLPYVKSIETDQPYQHDETRTVTIRFDVAQCNYVQGDLPVPERIASRATTLSLRQRLGRWIAGA